ncbi:ATP synthase subunit b', chloroplastic [Syzygium oleosum]|uniref:ATP synthase subunit b', chloroplastic n=1 Tax=Syzygium oleosum TaxID=219896 RepID=UPI0024B8D317|nr:ATP synthase subunit b', chloroplastic [Syzygium oleosum]
MIYILRSGVDWNILIGTHVRGARAERELWSLSNLCGEGRDRPSSRNLHPLLLPSYHHLSLSFSLQNAVGKEPSLERESLATAAAAAAAAAAGIAAMAKMIVASSSSCKTQIPPPFSASKPKQQPQVTLSVPKFRLPKPLASLSVKSLPLLTAAAAAASSALLAQPLPALAAEIEKAALFDFNLTLPVIMGEFLLLMFALDKIYFSPLGNFMDERDAAIREKLSSVKDTSAEVKQLEEQAAAVMRAARAEISAALSKMKKETQTELEQKLLEGRRKVEAELQEALATLESQKEQTIKALDSQIAVLSQDIVNKVLPIK